MYNEVVQCVFKPEKRNILSEIVTGDHRVKLGVSNNTKVNRS
jgi:hypothetical protein